MRHTQNLVVGEPNRRVLVVDDNESIHGDFVRLLREAVQPAELDAMEGALFASEPAQRPGNPCFEVACALRGEEGLAMAEVALRAGRPFAVAFVDMIMPLGWDGLTTIKHLWQLDPSLE